MTMPAAHTAMAPPSGWVQRWSHLVRSGGAVLDVACGGGRHLAWFAARGHAVTGIDIDTQAASGQVPVARLVQADIEQGPWPLANAAGIHEEFDAVVITNYLWRPLWGHLLASLAPGGVLLYETFSTGNETVGRPSRPDFLLQRAELLQVCAGLRIVAFEEGTLEQPARFVQRIAAVREVQNGQPPALPPVYLL